MGILIFRNAEEANNWSSVFNDAFKAALSGKLSTTYDIRSALHEALNAADVMVLSIRQRRGQDLLDSQPGPSKEVGVTKAPLFTDEPMPTDADSPPDVQ